MPALRRASVAAMAALPLLAFAPAASARVVSCGEVITEDTVMSHDLTCVETEETPTVLTIGANGVTLDLGGHTLTATSEITTGAIGIESDGHSGVTIRNGTVVEPTAGYAIYLHNGSHNRVDRVHAHGYGAILMSGSYNVIDRSVASGLFGLNLDGDHGLIRDTAAPRAMTYVDGSDHRVVDSSLSEVDVDDATRNVLRRNDMSSIDLDGGSDNVVAKNSISRAFVRNTSGNSILRNRMGDPSATESPVLRLMAGASHNLIAGNVVSRGTTGISVEAGATGNVLRNNTVFQNAADGILVLEPLTTLRRNIANQNGELGIEAVAGVTDAGGNRASGNGDPRQCVGVVCR